jgi:AraC family transcriptional regulator
VLRERGYTPGGTIERHCHRHTTLILVLEGELQEECEGRLLPRRPGELHLLPAGLPHTTTAHRAGARVFLVGLYDDWLNRSPERRLAVSQPAGSPSGTRPAQLGRRMYEEFRARDAAAALSIEGLVLQTLGILLQTRSRPPSNDVPPWLASVRDRLREEFVNPPPISHLAARAGVSTGYLHRAFRARFHCTPGDYVRRKRIEYVKRALRRSREPISRIAYAAGFGDQAHLTRSFRALVGVTPGAFRRLHGLAEAEVASIQER